MIEDPKATALVGRIVTQYHYPDMFQVRQKFDPSHIEDIEGHLSLELQKPEIKVCLKRVKPGDTVALTAGSRQIRDMKNVLRVLISHMKRLGAVPFIVPAMGSHGGATPEGQVQVLASFGITETSMGVPIKATMETVVVARTDDGRDVCVDKYAMGADHIIPVNRIKPHTCFRGPYESGLLKMMAIGLGKQHGAELCHQQGFGHMAENIQTFGKAILSHAPVLFGVGIVENAYDQSARIDLIPAEKIPEEEPKLLEEARRRMVRLLLPSCDVLVVDKMGKNFSGSGMDPNITGRFVTPYATGGISAQKLAVLDLSEESHGNCIGVGVADTTTRRLMDKACLAYGYINALSSLATLGTRFPMVLQNDKEAIGACLRGLVDADRNNARIIRIADTLHVGRIMVSKAMLDEVRQNPNLEVEGEARKMEFDGNGNLAPLPWEV